jgi:hypothetical protein
MSATGGVGVSGGGAVSSGVAFRRGRFGEALVRGSLLLVERRAVFLRGLESAFLSDSGASGRFVGSGVTGSGVTGSGVTGSGVTGLFSESPVAVAIGWSDMLWVIRGIGA